MYFQQYVHGLEVRGLFGSVYFGYGYISNSGALVPLQNVSISGGTFNRVEGNVYLRTAYTGKSFNDLFTAVQRHFLGVTIIPGPAAWTRHEAGNVIVSGGVHWDVQGSVYCDCGAEGNVLIYSPCFVVNSTSILYICFRLFPEFRFTLSI